MTKISVLWLVLSLAVNLCTANLWAVDPIDANLLGEAEWIAADGAAADTNLWTAFSRDFTLQRVPQRAEAYIAVDSKYWLWINGRQVVFEGGLKRGPNPTDTYADKIDLAPYLKRGSNRIAILVWYFGRQGFSHHSSGKPGMLFAMQMGREPLVSNGAWLASRLEAYTSAPKPEPNYRLPESNLLFDARVERVGWQRQDADLSWMQPARTLGRAGSEPWNGLVIRPVPMFKDFGLTAYASAPKFPFVSDGDTIICDLPYNAQVTPYLEIEAPEEGMKIVMATDNYLFYNGSDNVIRAEFITRKGLQAYESYGWMNGHKMYYFIPKGIKVRSLKYRETGFNTEFAGSFHSSDPFLNRYWEKARRTLYVTMRDTYMDCPERERAQWWGDAVNESGEAFYALDLQSHSLMRKGMYELIGWQRPDGSLFSPIPAGNWNRELPCQMLSSIGPYGFWNYYLFTADKQTIADLYPGVKRYLDIWKPDGKGTITMRPGDWTWGDWGSEIDKELIYNLLYYMAVKSTREMALLLEKPEDAAAFEPFLNGFAASFNRQFWTGSHYRHPAYTGKPDDRVQALAVLAGVVPEERYPLLLQLFQTEMHASPYMEKYVGEAMFVMGYASEALKRMESRFAKMVNHPGFSTLFEGWGIGSEGFGGGTVNHAWSGGGLTLASQYLCGIAPAAPGFSVVSVKPRPGYVKEASARMISVKGPITSEFVNDERSFHLTVELPLSVVGEIGIPGSEFRKISLNGRVIWENGSYRPNNRATFLEKGRDHITFRVPGGKLRFVAERK
ncbi:MAG: alpha-L-rhamnosidase C-terminal domain-containing protein [Bacteroidales bacterium]